MGVKFASQRWAMVLVRSPTIKGSEDTGRRPPAQPCWAEDPQPNHVGLGLFKGRPRRSASSDAPNGSPIHTLYMVKGHPKSKENARRSVGNHNCRIKCKEATFPAALIWRGQENSIILASVTHRKG